MQEIEEIEEVEDIKQNKLMAVLSYLGIMILLPILAAPNSKFARFHANQGLILIIIFIVYVIGTTIISDMLGIVVIKFASMFLLVLNLVDLALFVLMLLGIRNAYKGEFKELPYIGQYRVLK